MMPSYWNYHDCVYCTEYYNTQDPIHHKQSSRMYSMQRLQRRKNLVQLK